MELSTSEFVADILSASSVGGPSGVVPVLISALESGLGVRLVEAWPAGSLDIVQRALFLSEDSGHCYILPMIISWQVFKYTFATVSRS